jgi:cytochrome P450
VQAFGLTAWVRRLVEKILRMHSIIQYGVTRRATADIQLGGVRIAAGQDGAVDKCPHAIDTSQPQIPHLTFGYGVHPGHLVIHNG